jgi:hypothetical protein
MKRVILTALALSLSLLSAGYLLAQNKASAAAAAPAPKQQKLLKVATINTVEANREFQANVQKMQQQRQALVELDAKVKAEKDAKKKAQLQAELDKALAKLNDDDQKMQKAYGFSLARNYTLEIEKAHVYMFLTDEEAAKLEQQQKAKK